MVYVLTASGYFQDPEEFFQDTHQAIDDLGLMKQVISADAILWDNPSLINRTEQLLNSDELYPIVVQAINKIGEKLDLALQNYQRVVIISHSAGSLIVELALASFSESYRPKITHLMLAPAISGSSIASILRLLQPVLSFLITKYAVEKAQSKWWKLIFGIVGTVTTIHSLINTGIINQISNGIEPELLKDNIKRFIIYGDEDKIVTNPSLDLPNAEYYHEKFNHAQVGDLSNKGLSDTYSRTTDNKRMLKKQIIKEVITGFEIY